MGDDSLYINSAQTVSVMTNVMPITIQARNQNQRNGEQEHPNRFEIIDAIQKYIKCMLNNPITRAMLVVGSGPAIGIILGLSIVCISGTVDQLEKKMEIGLITGCLVVSLCMIGDLIKDFCFSRSQYNLENNENISVTEENIRLVIQ